ncbi:hypothetical protein [Terriglobus sp. ADX1]|uniref:hypothetical protein n=1 Tax=Terriglobus sp. ADX1 TaxID=2794063 RepID=UPI002FE6C2E1
MSYSASDLLDLSDSQLDDVFKGGTVGAIPDGEADGQAIIPAGTKFTRDIASIINIFAWQGKTFDAKHGTLTNRISALGVNAIVAQVYVGQSLFDGKDCIVLDYSKTSLLAKHVRDEIRLVGPQLYLGLVYWDTKRTIHFSLQFGAA